MAQEIKNTFLKAKMNKDLDDRIIPNGEYRDAVNISIGKSESNNVGSIENLIGNALLEVTDTGENVEIIGFLEDSTNDKVYIFLTNYTEPDVLNPTDAPAESIHRIYSYDAVPGTYSLLLQGNFLNFSKTNRILGINLIEELLFWTDNRNQPRKININLAQAYLESSGEERAATDTTDYYTEEHQISVAKYAPFETISLYTRFDFESHPGSATDYVVMDGENADELQDYVGATLVSVENQISGNEYIEVTAITNVGGATQIDVYPSLPGVPVIGSYITLIKSTMTNEGSDQDWPGDPDYLEDRFVRFSYRFKYDDNEYSLMAPFTQIAYIPKQKGYFIGGDEDAAYRSTVVDFMENFVQNVALQIPLPCKGENLRSQYKIQELEVLFKESDGVVVKVLDAIDVGEIVVDSRNINNFVYEYQSRKPYRSLSEAQTVRVYDKVPVRAFSQESSGNRIIYGNYFDQHTPPPALNYNCRIANKSDVGNYNNFIEYPNHTVKRNRNYQIGFVLSDKYGRTSPVILSNVDLGVEENNVFFSGSTIYNPYDENDTDTSVWGWFGDAIQVALNTPITSTKNLTQGTPGMYAEKVTTGSGSGEGYAIASAGSTINGNTYGFRLKANDYPQNNNIPQVGDYLRGEFVDFVRVESVTETNPAQYQYEAITDGQVSSTYLRTDGLPAGVPDLKFAYTINDLGWYSYKIVVKQNEQDYYNVYAPGILNGYPGQRISEIQTGFDPDTFEYEVANPFPNEIDVSAHMVLLNDNINKVPRDLKEVGPSDLGYRSSVVLYGRVTNNMVTAYDSEGVEDGREPSNEQYFPRTDYTGKNAIKHTVTQIANARDLNMAWEDLSLQDASSFLRGPTNAGEAFDGVDVFYGIDSDPLIAKISTIEKSIGWPNIYGDGSPVDPANMKPFLAIYETEPVISELDIFWETASAGLIVDLNQAVTSFNTGAAGFEGFVWEFDETYAQGDSVTNGYFFPLDVQGNPFLTPPTVELLRVENGYNEVMSDTMFLLQAAPVGGPDEGGYQLIYNGEGIYFSNESFEKDVYKFFFRVTSEDIVSELFLGGVQFGDGALQNIQPFMLPLSNVERTPSDTVILNAITGGENGSATANLDQEQVIYTFEFLGNEPVIGWPEWEMERFTGKITTESYSTPLGSYNIRVFIKDALGNQNGQGNYTSLSAQDDTNIQVRPVAVNPGLLTAPCQIGPDDGLVARPPTALFNNAFTGVGGKTRGAFYLTNSPLSVNDLVNADGDGFTITESRFPKAEGGEGFDILPNLVRLNPAGSGVHTSGTLQIEVNTVLKNPTNAFADAGEAGIRFFYRKKGATTWTKVKGNNVDVNNTPGDAEQGFKEPGNYSQEVFQNGSFSQWKSDFPTGTLKGYDNKRTVSGSSSNQPSEVYCQYVRAFNIEDMPNPEVGNEYLILLDEMWLGGASFEGNNYDKTQTLRAYCNYTDTHYPTCITRPAPQGFINGVNGDDGRIAYSKNIAIQQGGTDPVTAFRYNVTTAGNESNNRTHSEENDALTRFLYADTPFGELVETFYTDPAKTIAYVPPLTTNPYINFTWEGDAQPDGAGVEPGTGGTPGGVWRNWRWYSVQPWNPYKEDAYNPARSYKLKFTGGFDNPSGLRLKPNITGQANTIQTSKRNDYGALSPQNNYSNYGVNRFMRVYG
jgi:hypothetical protein